MWPADPGVQRMFDYLGQSFVLEQEADLATLQAVTCLMGSHFQLLNCTTQWAIDRGIADAVSANYVGQFFLSIAMEAQQAAKQTGSRAFQQLVEDQTP
eukprot:CAMPEP_0175157188 /NCGR_PEP_ID=MMETSP0087-20121206/22056_1 /TAXON_ID=136419 /ORGANISM="Unknown Unknown, Strain D1" /LENGTH=97 /DNA_ID=CAMNT_0016444755 /DNA_START=121 /DNA_END=410 /DNA_ORIENTATION=+